MYGAEGPEETTSDASLYDDKEHIYRAFTTVDWRLSSFKHWPISLKQSPEAMAKAGFYYQGYGDMVICYKCDLHLKHWEEHDDPWVEHIRWRSTCEHVRTEKDSDFIKNVLYALNMAEQWAKVEKKKTQPTLSEEQVMCAICKHKTRTIVYHPCWHLASCKTCGDNLLKCPLCG
ncbi:hypothetical protein AMK59_5172, partial [Oryctes borbonicus]